MGLAIIKKIIIMQNIEKIRYNAVVIIKSLYGNTLAMLWETLAKVSVSDTSTLCRVAPGCYGNNPLFHHDAV